MDPVKASTPPLAEMRIALAMSGAIALVLYESGVAHEVHAFLNKKGAYAKALQDARLKPVVDILTGASAGGINSIFLGNCFVTGADFNDFANVWIEMAGVDVLRYGVGEEPKSVLNVQVLRDRMGEIFKRHVAEMANPPLTPQQDDIKVRLCRTDLRGFCVSTVDAAGHRIDVLNRSDVVAFDNESFKNPNPDDIVDAAAATSAFPIAFPPVFNNGRWYVDGGLWDNQPIDLAVEAIKDKKASGRTHRCVFFVDPEPSIFADENDPAAKLDQRQAALAKRDQEERKREPSVVETAAFIPGLGVKGNVLPSLESILDFNSRIELYQQALGLTSITSQLEAIDKDIQKPRKDQGTDPFTRLSLLDQARINNVIFDGDPKLIQSWFAIRDNLGDRIQPLVDAAVQALALIDDADLARRYLRRRLRELNKELEGSKDPYWRSDEKQDLYRAIDATNKILEIELDSANDLIGTSLAYREHRRERVSRFWPISIRMLSEISRAMADPSGNVDKVITEVKGRWAASIQTIAPQNANIFKLGNSEIKRWREELEIRVEPQDRVRYVLASFSDLDEKRLIDLVRISPNDTDNLHLIGSPKLRSDQTPASVKLAGEGLGHMSGFLEERWRRNDYVWGRLDAAEILLRSLLTFARREANALGTKPLFDESAYKAALASVQDTILKEEALRLQPRDGKGTNPLKMIDPKKCGSVQKDAPDKATVDENKKIIGYGQEDIGDAIEPQFSKNVEYITQTLVRALRGASSKTPSALDRLGRIARVMSYVVLAFTWVLPLKPNTARAVWIRVAVVLVIGVLVFAWGWLAAGKNDALHVFTLAVEVILAVLALVGLGAGLGWKGQFAFPATLAVGVGLGITLRGTFPKAGVAGYAIDQALVIVLVSIVATMIVLWAVKSFVGWVSRIVIAKRARRVA